MQDGKRIRMNGETVKKERLYLLLALFVILMSLILLLPGVRKRPQAPAAKGSVSARVVAETKQRSDESVFLQREELERIFRERPSLAVTVNLATLLILATILLGILIDCLLLASVSGGRSVDIATYRAERPVRWGPWDVARVVILFMFFGYMLILIESFLVTAFPLLRNGSFRMVLNSIIMDTLAVICILHFAVGEHKERLVSLGLSLKNFTANVYYGIVGYLAAVPALVALVIVIAVTMNFFRYVPEKQAVVQMFMKDQDARFLVFASLFAAVVGPVIEEIFFRGFLYNALKKRMGVLLAMAVTAAAFAALHAHAAGFLQIMVIGMVLGYLYEKTGTLVAPVTAHILHNLSMMGFVFLLKQLQA